MVPHASSHITYDADKRDGSPRPAIASSRVAYDTCGCGVTRGVYGIVSSCEMCRKSRILGVRRPAGVLMYSRTGLPLRVARRPQPVAGIGSTAVSRTPVAVAATGTAVVNRTPIADAATGVATVSTAPVAVAVTGGAAVSSTPVADEEPIAQATTLKRKSWPTPGAGDPSSAVVHVTTPLVVAFADPFATPSTYTCTCAEPVKPARVSVTSAPA